MLYAFEGRRPFIGEGTYVSETAAVIGDVRTGKDCYIGHGARIRADYGVIEIGDGTAIEEGVIVHAPRAWPDRGARDRRSRRDHSRDERGRIVRHRHGRDIEPGG